MKYKFLIVAVLSIALSSCSSLRRFGLKLAAPAVYDAASSAEMESSYYNFKLGILGNLQLIDGLHTVAPTDRALLATLIKGYGGMAFAVNETSYLNDKFAENDRVWHLNQALRNYTKAIRYGLKYLALDGLEFNQLEKAVNKENGIYSLLDKHIDDDQEDLDAIFFMAQSLAGTINLSKTNIKLVAQLPIAKGMFDWVCEKNPNINFGACDIFYASYEASRPRMLGGNPEKGKQMFKAAIKKRPNNWLIRIAFLEHYIIPMSDEDLYGEQAQFMSKANRKHVQEMIWSGELKKNDAFRTSRLRFYQTVAIERFKIIKKYSKDIF